LVANGAPATDLAQAAAAMEAFAARLAEFPHGGLYRNAGVVAVGGPPATYLEFAPLLGRANPLAPPLTIEVQGAEVVGRARFGAAYEGPPGCVHGGFIAACFDDVLGMVQSVSGQPGMTGRLTVRYLAPTPLGTEVRFVGRLVGVDGRKISTRGDLYAGALRTAEAEALFITVALDRFGAGPIPKAPDAQS
jgi:acyl-coenzyme A thioesterase PaaI-like protein